MEKKNVVRLYESPEDPFLIEDYPWGFRLRTEMRCWVESKKGFGMRFCTQTVNPKTGKWCAAKKGTYCCILGLWLDEKGYLKTWGLSSGGWSKEEAIKEFEEAYAEIGLTQFQKDQIRYIRASNIVNEIVKYEIRPCEPINLTKVMDGDPVEQAKMIKNEAGQQTQEEKDSIINKAFAYGFAKVDGLIK